MPTATNIFGDRCELKWDHGSLCARLRPDISIHTVLGRVHQKNDGRWEWFVTQKNDFFKHVNVPKKPQGVASTEASAMLWVEGHWSNTCGSNSTSRCG